MAADSWLVASSLLTASVETEDSLLAVGEAVSATGPDAQPAMIAPMTIATNLGTTHPRNIMLYPDIFQL
jgi:hypothetical protein